MAADALLKPLRGIAIFAGLAPSQLAAIGGILERIVFNPGDTLIRDGAEGDASILIVAGEAVCVGGAAGDARAAAIAAGSLLAEMAMLTETVHSSTVMARTPVRALRIPRDAMHALMARDPDLAHHFVGRIAHRLTAMLGTLRNVDSRMAASLHHLAPPTARLLEHTPPTH